MTKSNGHQNARTEFVQVNGIKTAYRRFGRKSKKTPLLFLQHFTGSMDHWDPIITDGFAKLREVILYDYPGAGRSEGVAPSTIPEMTTHAAGFMEVLGLQSVDLFGFSLGGMIAQQLSVEGFDLIRRIILLGTGPRGGEGMEFAELGRSMPDSDEGLLKAFFSPSEESQKAGRSYLNRKNLRKNDRDLPVSREAAAAQLNAIREWGKIPTSDRYKTLPLIKHPVLVVNGMKDTVVPVINSFILAEKLPNALLIIYPDAAHGSHSQYHELFLQHATQFLGA
jgi:pimeloyl-ACP methyl ester carboxylesterase